MTTRRLAALFLSLSFSFLAGCGFSNVAVPVTDTASPALSGTAFGGQQPIGGALVSVFAVGTGGYGTGDTLLATTTTAPGTGAFSFAAGAYACPYANTPVYLLVQGGTSGSGTNSSLTLAAGLGNCSVAKTEVVIINEVTTAATAYALSQFFTPTLGATSTDNFGAPDTGVAGTFAQGIVSANSFTIPTLVTLSRGSVPASTATTTIEAAKINSIADVLAACVNSTGATSTTETTTACGKLFNDTLPPGATTRPSDTLQAAVQMALYPYQNVSALYSLTTANSPFPGLSATPNDWTVAVSYKTSTLGLGVSGSDIANGTSASMDIDVNGNIWVPSNKPGASGVAVFTPGPNTFAGPYGTAYLTRPQYLALDQEGIVWATDQSGSGNIVGVDSGSVDGGSPSGTPSYGTIMGVIGGPVADDWDDSIFFVVEDTQAPVLAMISADRTQLGEVDNWVNLPTGLTPIYNGADSSGTEYFETALTNGANTHCDVEIDETIAAQWYYGDFGNPGTVVPCISGGSASAAEENDIIGTAGNTNQLCSALDGCFAPGVPLNTPEGIATDGIGSEWVANSGNGSISTLYGSDLTESGNDYLTSSPIPYLHNSTNGATMTTPYGLAIDGSGNVWVANAGCVTASTTPCTASSFTLSELIGAAAPTITPLALQFGGYDAGNEPSVVRAHMLVKRNTPLTRKLSGKAARLPAHLPGTIVKR